MKNFVDNMFQKQIIPENIKNTNEKLYVKVEVAQEKDLQDYKKIRLEALEADPKAFHANPKTTEKEKTQEISEWKKDISGVDKFIVLLKNNSETIGMTKGTEKSKGIWLMRSVYLNKNFRKEKIGGDISDQMIKKFIEEIKKRGGEKILLSVDIKRKNAIRLYERFGFKKKSFISGSVLAKKILLNWQVMELNLNSKEDKL